MTLILEICTSLENADETDTVQYPGKLNQDQQEQDQLDTGPQFKIIYWTGAICVSWCVTSASFMLRTLAKTGGSVPE